MGPQTKAVLAWCVIVLLSVSCHGMKFDNDFNVVWQADNNILAQDVAESVDLKLTKAGGKFGFFGLQRRAGASLGHRGCWVGLVGA